MKILKETSPKITFYNEEIFIDRSKDNRSGHLGHAMVQCKDGSLLAFFSNCSGSVNRGHSMYGWVEYKRSLDDGKTWGETKVLQYSFDAFIDGKYKIGCEKAVCTEDGTIVLFCLRSVGPYFEPYDTPVYLLSHDNGVTWSEPKELSEERGRVYDAIYRDGRVYALEFCNSTEKGFTCNEEGKFYKIYASDNNGETFYEYSVIPFNTMGHAYGNIIFRPDSSLLFYAYNVDDEQNLTCLISDDFGKTWSEPFKSKVAKLARNPQVGYINGVYILHARSSGCIGGCLVVYTSPDGINWDEGTVVTDTTEGKPHGGYYSNNITLTDSDGKQNMLIQYSEDYAIPSGKVNIMHAWITVE